MAKVTKTESVNGVSTTPARIVAEKFNKEFSKQISLAADFKVVDIVTYNSGAATLAALTHAEKELKARKDAIVKPIKEGIKVLESEFKPHEERLASVKSFLKQSMDTWRNEENRKAEENRRKILADQRIKNPEVREAKLASVAPVEVSNTRKVLKLKVTDINAIPGEFFDLNESRLKDFLKGGGEVKGAELYYETITVS